MTIHWTVALLAIFTMSPAWGEHAAARWSPHASFSSGHYVDPQGVRHSVKVIADHPRAPGNNLADRQYERRRETEMLVNAAGQFLSHTTTLSEGWIGKWGAWTRTTVLTTPDKKRVIKERFTDSNERIVVSDQEVIRRQ